MSHARFIIAGLCGGSGKTLVSLGVTRAMALSGLQVKTFKKGPDYIDSTWLALAAQSPKGNLDPYFCPPATLLQLLAQGAQGYDVTVIEGNRGLFDGADLEGTASTASLAVTLQAPVVLVVDCTKMTRTTAALVLGCKTFHPSMHLAGVILNRTGTQRQRSLITEAVEKLAGVPVLGALPRHGVFQIEERSMGLAHTTEAALSRLDALAAFMEKHVNIPALYSIAQAAPELPIAAPAPEHGQSAAAAGIHIPECGNQTDSAFAYATAEETTAQQLSWSLVPQNRSTAAKEQPVIGYVQDAALWFYYQENLDALQAAGAKLVPLSILENSPWPEIHGLYLGGGMPEDHAPALSACSIRHHVYSLASHHMPIYAECGGFMYLCTSLKTPHGIFPMAGVFPGCIAVETHPNGLGYVDACVTGNTPFLPKGLQFRGHEFHFSRYLPAAVENDQYVLSLTKGKGIAPRKTGGQDVLYKWNTHAGYTHIYAPALPQWAPAFVQLAACWQNSFAGEQNAR